MIRKSIFFLFLLFNTALFAQQNEFGMGWGSSGYVGDLNTNHPMKFTDVAGNFFYRYNISEFTAHKFAIGYYGVQGADSNSTNAFQKNRNLSFRSNIFEVAWTYEFNFLSFIPKSQKERFSPYVFIGVAGAYFKPTATYNGSTYDLRSLGTEGQGLAGKDNKYANIMLAIPYGLGIKWNFGGNFTVGAELNYRFCFSDYLDDVSGLYANKSEIREKNGDIAAALSDRSGEQNGNSYNGLEGTQRGDARGYDQYYNLGINLSYTIIPYRCPALNKIYKRNYFF